MTKSPSRLYDHFGTIIPAVEEPKKVELKDVLSAAVAKVTELIRARLERREHRQINERLQELSQGSPYQPGDQIPVLMKKGGKHRFFMHTTEGQTEIPPQVLDRFCRYHRHGLTAALIPVLNDLERSNQPVELPPEIFRDIIRAGDNLELSLGNFYAVDHPTPEQFDQIFDILTTRLSQLYGNPHFLHGLSPLSGHNSLIKTDTLKRFIAELRNPIHVPNLPRQTEPTINIEARHLNLALQQLIYSYQQEHLVH
jgi:hypothetical protein